MVELVEEEVGARKVGAFKVFPAAGIGPVPMYLLSFDKEGACISPRTRAQVLSELSGGGYSTVHVYSHGWNNVFTEAVAHYTEFFTEYFSLRAAAGMDNRAYRPLIVGILWPSTAFLAAGEATPSFAAGAPPAAPPAVLAEEVAAALPPAQAARVAELALGTAPLSADASAELAGLLLPALAGDERPGGIQSEPGQGPDVDAVLSAWGAALPAPGARPGQPRQIPDAHAPGAPMYGMQTAGLLGFLNPREILRKTTVFMMKDRAGVIGRSGVGALVRDLLDVRATLQVHLTGHSYGARVMLSALASLRGPRKVASVLLLQPAVNAWCFAEHVGGPDGPAGAYRAALANAAQPVHTTFSEHDEALGRFFELALRRRGEHGDLLSAGPDREYAALGAIGPLGMAEGECLTVPIAGPPQRDPPPAPGVRVVALDGSAGAIASHGDVRNPFTEWAMARLVETAP
jgi:hypothetical protein